MIFHQYRFCHSGCICIRKNMDRSILTGKCNTCSVLFFLSNSFCLCFFFRCFRSACKSLFHHITGFIFQSHNGLAILLYFHIRCCLRFGFGFCLCFALAFQLSADRFCLVFCCRHSRCGHSKYRYHCQPQHCFYCLFFHCLISSVIS